MNNGDRYETILSDRNTVSLLFYLLDAGEISASDLRTISKNYYTMVNLCSELRDRGLVKIREERSPKLKHVYSLTKKGEKVAKKLLEAQEIIEEE